MKWSPKKNYEYLFTGSSTNEDLLVLTGTNDVETIGIFKILICRGGGGAVKWSPKKNFECLCTGSGANEDLSVLTCTNEIQTIGIFEILICFWWGASEMVP